VSKLNSIATTSADKPSKPYREFPLFPHATKHCAKKISGHLHYFDPVALTIRQRNAPVRSDEIERLAAKTRSPCSRVPGKWVRGR
jgi:hypothetical protein